MTASPVREKNGRLRLCIMTTVPLTVEFFYGQQIDFLKSKGFDITVITSPDGFFDKRVSGSCRLVLIPMIRGISPIRDLAALWRLFHELRDGRFDIVQYCSPKAAFLGSIAAFTLGIPVRLYLMWGLFYTGQAGFARALMRTAEKIICSLSTHVSPDSRGNREFAVREKICRADKISVVGAGSANGVDLERFNPDRLLPERDRMRQTVDIPPDAVVIGFAGRVRADKGIDELVMAFAKLAVRHAHIYLLLVGPLESDLSPIGKEAEELIAHHPRIRHCGYQEAVEKFMAVMDIFVLPSYREGFGSVTVEAAAMGLPVVSTSIEGIQDAVRDNETGFLVPVRSVNGLAEKIDVLIADIGLRKKMGAAGRQWAQKFEQKRQWEDIFLHRKHLLEKAGINTQFLCLKS